MKSFRDWFCVLSCFILVSYLTACGGGSSSSGGGTSFAGTYSGTWNATLSAGGTSQSGTGIITIVVNPDGTVVIDPETSIPGTGSVNGNSFTGGWDASSFNTPGLTCSGSLSLSGTISGNTVTGTIGPSQFICNGVQFTARGTFTASKTAKALINGTHLIKDVQKAARQVWDR